MNVAVYQACPARKNLVHKHLAGLLTSCGHGACTIHHYIGHAWSEKPRRNKTILQYHN